MKIIKYKIICNNNPITSACYKHCVFGSSSQTSGYFASVCGRERSKLCLLGSIKDIERTLLLSDCMEAVLNEQYPLLLFFWSPFLQSDHIEDRFSNTSKESSDRDSQM